VRYETMHHRGKVGHVRSHRKDRSSSRDFIRCQECDEAGKEVFKAAALSRKAWALYKAGSSHFVNHEPGLSNIQTNQPRLPTL